MQCSLHVSRQTSSIENRWLTSLFTLAQVLSRENEVQIRTVFKSWPQSTRTRNGPSARWRELPVRFDFDEGEARISSLLGRRKSSTN
jgi:hypothetical protein